MRARSQVSVMAAWTATAITRMASRGDRDRAAPMLVLIRRTSQALEKAREAGLDLVEMVAGERPPVCKILDYGKMRFANSQKGNKAGKVRQQKLKEIRVRPKTGGHDVDTKVGQARKFLEHNDKD